MLHASFTRAFGVLFVMAAMATSAPAANTAKPTDAIALSAFARHSTVSDPVLSPKGTYLALSMDTGQNHHALVVYRLADMKVTSMLRMPIFELAVGIHWVSDTRLVIEKGREYGSLDQPSRTGEIIATDYDGKHQDYLYGYRNSGRRRSTRQSDYGTGTWAGRPDVPNGHFYMYDQPWDDTHESHLYDINSHGGARHLIGDIGVYGMGFMVGHDGQAHFAFGTDNDFHRRVFHMVDGRWRELSPAAVGDWFSPLTEAPQTAKIYALWAPHGGPDQLIEVNEDGSQRQVLAKDDFGSEVPMFTPSRARPFAAVTDTGVPKVTYLDPTSTYAQLHAALIRAFHGQMVSFVDWTDDGSTLLFEVYSDQNPGSYYLIDTHTHKVRKLMDVADWIDPTQMAHRQAFTFTASDGMKLSGFLTLPKGRSPFMLPMVLMPHGGPFDVSDDWGYDDLAQMLASRGYLVLQVNFRGSSGRGLAFEHAGYKKWGTRIQQDLIDGVKWAIDQHYADPKRVAVFGASFGGYSALMEPIRAPGLFRCAIGYSGIYDLPMMRTKGDIQSSQFGRSYLDHAVGSDEATLEANSPDRLVDKIHVPVFLIHGEKDQRAPFAQAQAMRAALEKAHKPVQWMAKPGEYHGFYDVDNNVQMYQAVLQFLGKYIGPGATATRRDRTRMTHATGGAPCAAGQCIKAAPAGWKAHRGWLDRRPGNARQELRACG